MSSPPRFLVFFFGLHFWDTPTKIGVFTRVKILVMLENTPENFWVPLAVILLLVCYEWLVVGRIANF